MQMIVHIMITSRIFHFGGEVMKKAVLLLLIPLLLLTAGCTSIRTDTSAMNEESPVPQTQMNNTNAKTPENDLVMVPDEMPKLPDFLTLDEGVEIDLLPKTAYALFGEAYSFNPQVLIDCLFLNSKYEIVGGNYITYVGESVDDSQDRLSIGNSKKIQSADNSGWFEFKRLMRLIPVEEPYCWDTTLRLVDVYAPQPYGHSAQARVEFDARQSPGVAPYLSTFGCKDFSFMSFSDAQTQVKQVLNTLGLDDITIRYGCAMDVEIMNKLRNRPDDPIPEDRDVYCFELIQSFDSIPILDSAWFAKETEKTRNAQEEGRSSPLSSTTYDPRIHLGTGGEVFINQYGLIQMDISGMHRFQTAGEAMRLISCAKALETVIAFYKAHLPQQNVRVSDVRLAYVTVDVTENDMTYRYIPAWIFDIWEYDTRENNDKTMQYATLNRFVIDAVTGERLSDNG